MVGKRNCTECHFLAWEHCEFRGTDGRPMSHDYSPLEDENRQRIRDKESSWLSSKRLACACGFWQRIYFKAGDWSYPKEMLHDEFFNLVFIKDWGEECSFWSHKDNKYQSIENAKIASQAKKSHE